MMSWTMVFAVALFLQSGFTRSIPVVDVRLRGLAAVDDRAAWVAGSQGTVLRTEDGGDSWIKMKVSEGDELEFRDLHAIDAKTAVVLAIGAGRRSRILRTTDGGLSWTTTHVNLEERGFLDAMAFWDDGRGIVLGDPVDGRFQILLTEDGGRRWTPLDPAGMPAALPHESAFAASGTCVCVAGDGRAWFGTGGGGQARVFSTVDGGRNWRASTTPIDASNESSGIFSISFDGEGRVGLAVGGDYKLAERAVRSIAKTSDGGRTWSAEGLSSPLGYRSAVTRLSKDTWLVVGPSGSDLTVDGGASWRSVDRTSFDSVSVAGSTVWVSGERGGVARRRIREIIEKHRHD